MSKCIFKISFTESYCRFLWYLIYDMYTKLGKKQIPLDHGWIWVWDSDPRPSTELLGQAGNDTISWRCFRYNSIQNPTFWHSTKTWLLPEWLPRTRKVQGVEISEGFEYSTQKLIISRLYRKVVDDLLNGYDQLYDQVKLNSPYDHIFISL